MGWITALKSGAVARLANASRMQLDLFDERNLVSFTSEAYPGDRLVACRNPELSKNGGIGQRMTAGVIPETPKALSTVSEVKLFEHASKVYLS